MIIYFNNKPVRLKNNTTIEEALMLHDGLEHRAVWLNGNHIALSDFTKIHLYENDRLKVVRISGGG